MIAGEGRIAGSFRDPAGYVFLRGTRVFRAVDAGYDALLVELEQSGLLAGLSAGLVIPSARVTDPQLRASLGAEHPGAAAFLEHEPLDFISYPHEWCVSMLADAGVLTLDLQLALLKAGLSLKDASAFNVQFRGARPVFIDLTSIERPARLDLWVALAQFGQMFTFPLLLTARRGWDLRSYFLGSIGGRSLEQVARGFGRMERLAPSLLLDLTLPLVLGRRAERGDGMTPALPAPGAQGQASAQAVNLNRLRGKVRAIANAYRPESAWASYTATCSYDDAASAAKKALIRSYLERWHPRRVLDLGCNTGEYSYLAAETGARVIAVDQDHDAVELLYRRLREGTTAITPIVADLTQPSPGLGFRNQERQPLLERLRGEAVFALALMHHLLVSGNLPLAEVRDLLADLTTDHLVLEFVPPADPMFQRLLRLRAETFDWLTLAECRGAFEARFTVVEEHAVPGTPRTLLFLRRR